MDAAAHLLANGLAPAMFIGEAFVIALLIVCLVYLGFAWLDQRDRLDAALGELETLRQVYGTPVSLRAPVPHPAFIVPEGRLAKMSADELAELVAKGRHGSIVRWDGDSEPTILPQAADDR